MTETPIALLVACQDSRSPPQPGTSCAAGDIHPGHGADPAISCSQWEAVQGAKSVRLDTVPELRARGGRGKNGLILTAVRCGKLWCSQGHWESAHLVLHIHSSASLLLHPTTIPRVPSCFHLQTSSDHRGWNTHHSARRGRMNILTYMVNTHGQSCCLVDSAAWSELQSRESTYRGSLFAVFLPCFKHLPFSIRKLYRGKFVYASGSSSLLPGIPE